MSTAQDKLTPQEMIEVDITIEQLETAIAKRDKLKMLQANPLFKEVILEGYMEQNAIRLVHLVGASQMQSEEQQKSLQDQIRSIGLLGEWFRSIFAMGDNAEKSLNTYTEELNSEEG